MSIPSTSVGVADEDESHSLWGDAWQRLRGNRLALVGCAIILFYVLAALIGPVLIPYDFMQQDLDHINQGPTAAHWLGTDNLGRDILARIIYGARTALTVAVAVTSLSLLIGLTLGAIAGYFGGRVDRFIMWLTDMTMSVPSLLLVVVVNASLKPFLTGWMDKMFMATKNPAYRNTTAIDLALVFGIIALVKWPQYARLVRGQVLSIRNTNYVTAARALGLSTGTIIRAFIIPNALGPVIVAVSFGLGTAMVLESAFSFLGIGVQPPTPSWGRMISDGMRSWGTYPHLLTIPALTLAIITMACALVGDGLNEALNPKGRRR